MQNSVMKAWWDSSHMAGSNAAYVEELYETYLENPLDVTESWKSVFDDLPKVEGVSVETNHTHIREEFRRMAALGPAVRMGSAAPSQDDSSGDVKQVKVLQLINAYRFRGHQHANLDPLGLWKQERVRDLELSHHNLSESDFNAIFSLGSYAVGKEKMPLGELFKSLNRTYGGSIGSEYMHITDTEQKRWIQQCLESVEAKPTFNREAKIKILKGLVAADGMEKYLGNKFTGAKRFSLEGGDSLVPMLKGLITEAGAAGAKEVVLGMAHRGRLNVLVNVLGKNPSVLFDEFAGKHDGTLGAGDVKYHAGFSSDFATPGGDVHLALAFNPSHLEIVNPVVMGSVRARLARRNCLDGSAVLPVTIHGDAAIAGQGVVQETFNMSQTRGYSVGGTVRIVINNQVGFTTSKIEDARSTQYCTDIAKMVQAPIFHVNADDPEAVSFVTKIALDYRNKFKRDVVIDLVCYRRHGHNEADEPSATQPLMYKKIKKHPVAKQIYAEQLIAEGIIEKHEVDKLAADYRAALDHGACVVEEWRPMTEHSVDWSPYLGHDWDVKYEGSVTKERLVELGKSITSFPESHKLHSRINKLYNDRVAMISGERMLDWGMAENLAYATILDIGTDIRITGQDTGRGTFFHRHAVLHSQTDGAAYIPLQHLHAQQGEIEIHDSVLSEAAVMAFEYGFATAEPATLTIWEAQFGDFANGAQVVFDQFMCSGEAKWGRLCGLTVLLPHGYEGQGPEHSSARLERFLQLCADHNWQVCVPSTPAQVYNMLRRQAVRPMRKPLIVMSPKSLLRHPLAVSSLEELAEGVFYNVIDEIDKLDTPKVDRVVMCSGKVYYDLLEQRRENKLNNVAVVRIEQLYPFPSQELAVVAVKYAHVKDWVWCQEEPQNQGAWYSSQHHFRQSIPTGATLTYTGRDASASPAVGYISVHNQQQKTLVEDALTIKQGT
ncbi:MAG: 2-oxoglutarate dehydrogenase E1 component [Kangiellaceae bacterium]|jgi:2-oxoglutarate dehydrogenase E1 component